MAVHRMNPRTLTKRAPQEAVPQPRSNELLSRVPLIVTRSPPKASIISGTPPQPYTRTEQYWAARALSAEALLSARTTHHNEVRGILLASENKRTTELYELAREHNARHARLEKFVVGLCISLLTFAIYVIYLLAHSSHQRPRETSRWSTPLPNHFTIPILSPFASVVESETAVVGARTIAMFIVVVGAVAYGVLRSRMNSTRG